MSTDRTPLPVAGFTAAGIACGIKKNGERDLMIIASDRPCAVAGTFTRNLVRAAPVEWTRQIVSGNHCRALVVNSGNANAYTGDKGRNDTKQMAGVCADLLDIPADQVAVASTGVISQPLPMDAISSGIPVAANALRADGWLDAADAIRTTDTVPKFHSVSAAIDGVQVTLTGIAKGSGMIHPNMATMLGFLFTDAHVDATGLQAALSPAVERSFNRITVDGDTSTNDCVLLLANGHAGGEKIVPGSPAWDAFAAMVNTVCAQLARAIVADAEGATKLVTITVTGMDDEAGAVAIARQVATSNLVKTALFGADPNWGRILAAAGQAGVPFDIEGASLMMGDVLLVKNGTYQGAYEDDIQEVAAAKVMATDEYTITLTLGSGPGTASYLTCDLSYDYVRINADYRT